MIAALHHDLAALAPLGGYLRACESLIGDGFVYGGQTPQLARDLADYFRARCPQCRERGLLFTGFIRDSGDELTVPQYAGLARCLSCNHWEWVS